MARLGARAKKRRNTQIVLTVVLALAVVAGVSAAAYHMLQPKATLNKADLCPSTGPQGHYVLLVDKTDPLNFTQKQAFMVTLKELVERRLPEGFLMSVFLLGEDFKSTAEPLVELCNPGTGEDKSELTANKRKLRRQFEERFLEPMLKQSESLVSKESAKYSPIFEMLQLVGINGFRKHEVKGERRLIVMSDMLHNTYQFSMYKGPVDFEPFASTDYGRKAMSDLRDVQVELLYLINSPQLQTKRNLKFWEDFFNKAGARVVAVRPLEG
jgi:hypothetical protein